MALSFNKMTFGQVSRFIDLLKSYLDAFKDDTDKEDMDISLDVSMESMENEDEGNVINQSRLGERSLHSKYLGSIYKTQFTWNWTFILRY